MRPQRKRAPKPKKVHIRTKSSPFLKFKREIPTAVDTNALLSESDTEEHSKTEWTRDIKQERDGNNITIKCSFEPPPKATQDSGANASGKRRTKKPDWYGNNVMGAIDSDKANTDVTGKPDPATGAQEVLMTAEEKEQHEEQDLRQ